ncbi:glycoside hydrolase family 31 protein [Aquibacillus rhizosphaerae]|uniref:Glycoside hydrolase family 31 protein n=1 Tax=Aquibacillus rhizosphaerae TaxID=3051431 RepID=A0ABT7LCI9_9BACI|nr:TIM-barrel domain-containing protein [Aquibacillus sp. LR5S19]MDL4842885.1 glycoside hydrolase family 31 protein [Aquibacillus sp. LR5S19]
MLEDTSFAIHPGKKQVMDEQAYIDIGRLQSVEQKHDYFLFHCEKGSVTIAFYRDDIVRITMQTSNQTTTYPSRAVVVKPNHVNLTYSETDDKVKLNSKKLTIEAKKSPFRIKIVDCNNNLLVEEGKYGMGLKENGEVICFKEMDENNHFYGFGEKTGFLDKRGERYQMWNSDVYAPHNPETDPLYESIPYFMTLRDGLAHGIFFDNSYRTTFDMKSLQDQYSFKAEGGQLDYYVFAGPTPKDVVEQYSYLTGRMPIPPKWSLGYHQSRYSYETEAEVRELVKMFIEKEIPVDAIYLDIHYMDEYRVFTFDKDRFPNPKKLIDDLIELGIRIVPIVDPGVKKDPEYSIYKEGILANHFCKYIEGNHYFGEVWPGISAFPDFTDEKVRSWWGDKHKFYSDLGIEGIWNDMNEPAVFNETKTMDIDVIHRNDGSPDTHRALHNIYGLMMGQATYDGMKSLLNGKRPFLLTRAGYSGVQRYASVWTGDNRSFWEHLQMSLPMCMNLGLSGIPFTGPDVGGFAHDTNAELLTRWTQVGAFMPYFRNHSAIGTVYQEPWQFGEKYEQIMKKYIQLRYKWMPQLYSLFYIASSQGLPVMRPLMMEFPFDVKTYNLNDQFMIGDNVVIAPIMNPGITDRAVYLPEGDWVDYETNQTYHGSQTHLIHANLDQLPIFIKNGTAITHGKVVSSLKEKQEELILHVYTHDKDSNYIHTFYEDDGETFSYENQEYLYLMFEIINTSKYVEINLIKHTGNYPLPSNKMKLDLHNLQEKSVFVNKKKIENLTEGVFISLVD